MTHTYLNSFKDWSIEEDSAAQSTTSKRLSTIRTYCKLAVMDGKMIANPFDRIVIQQAPKEPRPLSVSDEEKLYRLWQQKTLPIMEQNSLSAFLFCCRNGGIRISDISTKSNEEDWPAISHDQVLDGFLTFRAYKNRNYPDKRLLKVYIDPKNRPFIVNDAGPLFKQYTHQIYNRSLKSVVEKANLDHPEKVSFHTSRTTFISRFLEKGGNPAAMMQITGITQYDTVKRYTKISTDVLEEEIKKMNSQ